MAFSAPATLLAKWPLFTKYGATKTCVYQSMDVSSYEPGNAVIKPVLSSHTLEIIFDSIQASLIDESTIRSIDRYAIFPALLLPVAPKLDDLIVDSSLREWEVRAVVTDPVDAHFQLHVRPISG